MPLQFKRRRLASGPDAIALIRRSFPKNKQHRPRAGASAGRHCAAGPLPLTSDPGRDRLQVNTGRPTQSSE